MTRKTRKRLTRGKRFVRFVQKWMLKDKENNKSTFYLKINGFLFGSLKNNRYLCKQIKKETNIINHFRLVATV